MTFVPSADPSADPRAPSPTACAALSKSAIGAETDDPSAAVAEVAMVMVRVRLLPLCSKRARLAVAHGSVREISDGSTEYCAARAVTIAVMLKYSHDNSRVTSLVTAGTCSVSLDPPVGTRIGFDPPGELTVSAAAPGQ